MLVHKNLWTDDKRLYLSLYNLAVFCSQESQEARLHQTVYLLQSFNSISVFIFQAKIKTKMKNNLIFFVGNFFVFIKYSFAISVTDYCTIDALRCDHDGVYKYKAYTSYEDFLLRNAIDDIIEESKKDPLSSLAKSIVFLEKHPLR